MNAEFAWAQSLEEAAAVVISGYNQSVMNLERRSLLSQVLKSMILMSLMLAIEPLHPAEPQSIYFDLGPKLVQEFRGTYEFKYMRREFNRIRPEAYTVRSSGDESPREDKLILSADRVYWVLGKSGEQLFSFRSTLRHGDQWTNRFRGWDQKYKVEEIGIAISVPAGEFKRCAKVTVSWIAREHDMNGPQRIVLYLAPHLGIIKREVWESDEKWHEEVLTSFKAEK